MSGGAVAPNAVTLRGPGSGLNGYCYQASTTELVSNPSKPTSTLSGKLRAPSGTTDPTVAKRLVNVQITPAPNPQVIVQIDFLTGNGWEVVLNEPAPANTPSTYKFGFTGSTGGVTDVHMVRNVTVKSINRLSALTITKQVDRNGAALPAVITAGTQIPYQYVVTNAGLESVHSLTVTDGDVATVTCDAVVLPPAPDPSASTVCRGTYTVTPADVAAGFVTRSAQATGLGPGPTNTPVTSSLDPLTVQLVSKLALTKAVTTPAPYVVGGAVRYAYTVQNVGGSAVSSIAITDNRAGAAKVICDATNLAPGEVANCTLDTTILAGSIATNGSLVNTAVAAGVTPLGQTVTSAQAQVSIQVGTDIQVAKTVDVAAPLVGQHVTFTVTATNTGLGVASTVVINDVLPTGLALVSSTPSVGSYVASSGNWTIPIMAVGSPPATLTVVATVMSAGVITNAATLVSLAQPDINASNNVASVTLNPIVPTSDIAVNIFVDSASIRVGGTATYTLSATNNGPQPATGVSVASPLPSLLQFVSTTGDFEAATGIWAVGTLPVGHTASVDVTVRATAVGSFLTTATAVSTTPQDVNQSNDVDSAHVTVTPAVADLQIVKTVVAETADIHVGDFVTYFATVTNAGPDTVPDVVATESLIAGLVFQASDISASNPSQGTVNLTDLTWSIGSLAPGESATFSVRAQVTAPGTKNSVSTVGSATVTDPDLGNNSDTASFTTGPAQLDVVVTKTRTGPAQVNLGQSVSFTVTVKNEGPADATDVAIYDPLPPEFSFALSSVSGGSFDPLTGIWSLPSLPSGRTETLMVTATTVQPRFVTNTATLQSLNESDTNVANNSASASVEVVESADLAIDLTVSPSVAQPGGIVTYILTVTNHGPNTAHSVQAVDPLTLEATITGFTIDQGSFDQVSHVWDIGTLASGQTATLTVDRRMTRAGTFLNTMIIGQSSVPDPDSTNNSTQVIVEVPSANLHVAVSVDDSSPVAGQQLVITIVASNVGPGSATSAIVSALLPAGLSYVSSVPSVGSYDESTGLWTIGTLSADGSSETLTIVATATASVAAVSFARISATFPFDPVEGDNTTSISVNVLGSTAGSGGLLSSTGYSAAYPLGIALLLLVSGTAALLIVGRRRAARASSPQGGWITRT